MIRLYLFLFVALLITSPTAAIGSPETSCTNCHSDAELFEEDELALVRSFSEGVHAEVDLSCHDCHGGNPDPALSEDADGAMDPEFEGTPFLGTPERAEIPHLCGGCHSDPSFMRRFRPDPRIDQETEYWTSHHGRAIARGDLAAATCIDCHGVHGILYADDSRSPVYPLRVAETCSSCHADPGLMAGRRLPDGRPLPVDQFARWRQSMHAQALIDKEDLSAPTCNDCHGNHGAAPPGLESVAFVCGQCHGRETSLFRASNKQDGFRNHNEMLAEEGTGACRDCHDASEPQFRMTKDHFSECATCHDNHATVRPTIALLGSLPATPCAFCHEGPDGTGGDEQEEVVNRYEATKGALLEQAKSQGLEGNARFDWLVDRALELPLHSVAGSGEQTGVPMLRPQFARLFSKFRIGKTTYTYLDPVTNQETAADFVSCDKCHAADPELADGPVGLSTARVFRDKMHELIFQTAKAERILLSAKRGGVHAHEGPEELDMAVDAQIELEVLVHTFSSDESGAFAQKFNEGMEHASAAASAGQGAMEELSNRRRGLVIALILIVLTLFGLGFKILRSSGVVEVVSES